jgi:DNA-binding CsgD family transcriptional regulator
MSARVEGPRALVLTGEPGVGKSALLQDAVQEARARQALIFRSTGVQTESTIELSALHQLVHPLMRAVHGANAWLTTLERTFTPGDERPATAFEISNAVIGILDLIAGPGGVLLVVDDAQWIDPASATMLAFIARRIDNPLICVLLSLRSGLESPLALAGLPEMAVRPLAAADAAFLLEQSAGDLDATIAERLLVESAGNPLAIVELPKALSAHQRVGDESSSDRWTLTLRLESVYAERLADLSENARWLLLLCALDRTGRVATIKQAAQVDWWFPDLVAANDAGVLELDGDRVVFRHPLARSAVVQASSRTAQRDGHARLAEALRGEKDSWAWHRAAASDGPDDDVADALALLGRRAFAGGDFRSALHAMLRAIDLTSPGDVHDVRAARTAFLANVTGQIEVARRVLPPRPRGHRVAPVAGRLDETEGYIAATTAFWLMTVDVDVDTAAAVLLRALRGTRNISDRWVLELFDLLVLLCLRSGRADLWGGLNVLIDDLGTEVPAALAMTRDALGDPARTAHGFAARTRAYREAAAGGLEPWQLMWLAACSVYVDDLPVWRGEIRRVIEEEEVGGSLGSFLTALVLSSLDGLASGEWTAAVVDAERGLRTADRLAFQSNVGDFRSVLAVIAARRGDFEAARAHVRALQEWALPRGLQDHRVWSLFGEAQIELAQQHYDEAYGLLVTIGPAGVIAPYQPVALMAFMDTVAAAWKSGRRLEARAHVAAAREAHIEAVSPRAAFHLAACEAMVSDMPTTAALFESALEQPGIAQWPFDEARVRLVFGSWLRETGHEMAARPHLQVAVRIFDRLGAQPWRDRARGELRNATEHHDPVVNEALALLTPQETRIAVLASEGRSNNAIAAELFLSPRTVASHLYRIFPKLDVTSRAGLHQRLNPSAVSVGRKRP